MKHIRPDQQEIAMKNFWNDIKDIVLSVAVAVVSTFGLYALLAILGS